MYISNAFVGLQSLIPNNPFYKILVRQKCLVIPIRYVYKLPSGLMPCLTILLKSCKVESIGMCA